ncbi:hypothetical protein HJC23_013909 [Cyclotella cryptica]|uniref:RCC1-like domain-containing protein n=1 Tax=Cyclotella cryptica TaxID=29204 RepID=A0ABD3QI12_9STRA
MKSYVAVGFGNNFFYPLGADALPVPPSLLDDADVGDGEVTGADIEKDEKTSDANGSNGNGDHHAATTTTKKCCNKSSLDVRLLPLQANSNSNGPTESAVDTTTPSSCDNARDWILANTSTIPAGQVEDGKPQHRQLNAYASTQAPIVSCGATHTTFVFNESSSFSSSSSSGQAHLLGTIFGHVHAKLTPQPTRLPLKIVRIASGRRHVLALTEGANASNDQRGSGILLSWGAGHFGQLGHGSELTSSLEPRIVERLLPQSVGGRIIDIAAGGLHSMAVVAVENGLSKVAPGGVVIRETKAFAWGSNRKSQCGIEGGKCATVPSPMPVVLVKREERKGAGEVDRVDRVVHFEKLEGGRLHSVGLTAYGEVFTWGSTSMGRCGQSAADTARGGDRRICQEPRYVSALRSVAIYSIAAGDAHTLALSKNGRVFAWGAGGDGQCGQGHIGNLFTPKSVMEVYFEDCEKDAGVSHDVNGGSQHETDFPRPNSNVEFEVAMEEEGLSRVLGMTRAEKRIVKIRASGCYSAAVTSQGEVYTWGYGSGAAIGHPIPSGGSSLPMLPLIEGNQYSYSTTAKVYPEGCSETDNVRDCYSFDTELNVLMPRRVEAVRRLGLHAEDVSLGPGHMVIVCSLSGSTDDNGIQHSNQMNQSAVDTFDNNQNSDNDSVPNGDPGQAHTSDLPETLIPLNEAFNTESGVNASMASTGEAASITTHESVESCCNSKTKRRQNPSGFLAKIKSSRSSRESAVSYDPSRPCASKEKKKSFLPVGKLIDAAFHRSGGK